MVSAREGTRLMLVLALVVLIVALGLTYWIRKIAIAFSIMDVPNDRSSHSVVTPRGGGLAIVIAFCLGLAGAAAAGVIPADYTVQVFPPLLCIAAIGFLDDLYGVRAIIRLMVQVICAILALVLITYIFPLSDPASPTSSLIIQGIVVLCLVWMTNLYNFMDGIDGLAGIEGVTVCAGAAVFLYLSGNAESQLILVIILTAAIAGFLVWNWPPARIFMGDVGSGSIGFLLALFALYAARVSVDFLAAWLVLVGVFVVDSTITLIRRAIRRKNIFSAHRSHAYQVAARHYGSHLKVSVSVGLINILWLTPIAVAIGLGLLSALTGLAIAYIPLVVAAFRFHAGAEELQ